MKMDMRIFFVIILLMIVSAVSACQKAETDSAAVVQETDPYFSSSEHVIYMPSEEVSMSGVSNIRVTGDAIIVSIQYMNELDEAEQNSQNNQNSQSSNANESIGEETIIYSLADNSVKTLDMRSRISSEVSMCMSIAMRPDGYAEAMYVVYDEDTATVSNQWFVIDLGTGEVISEETYHVEDVFPDYLMAFEIDDKGNRYFISGDTLAVFDEAGEMILSLKDEGLTGTLQYSDGLIYAGKSVDQSLGSYYCVNIDKGCLEASSRELSIGAVMPLDGNTYSLDNEKLISDSSGEPVFSWLDTDANLSHYLQQCHYIVQSPDRIYALGVVEKSNQVSVFCSLLTKEAQNLQAGKQILDIGGINILSDMDLLASIYEYNLFADDVFLRINNYAYDSANEEQDYDEICRQLYQDVKEENGIDIVMNMGEYPWVSQQGALLDVSGQLSDVIADEEYFGNLISSFFEGDKLFQVPVCVSLSGLLADADAADKQAMTWGEMTAYISAHPTISEGFSKFSQQEWLNYLLANSAFELYSQTDTQSTLNREELRAMLVFSKEIGKFSDSWSTGPAVQTAITASDSAILSVDKFADVINASYFQGHLLSIIGFPSTEGSGLGITPIESAAVSAQCKNPEAAVNFVKILLSSTHQNALAGNEEGIPVKCESVEKEIENAFWMYENSSMFGYYYQAEPTTELADRYRKIIRAADRRCGYDEATFAIIQEEAIVYFADQNDADTVMEILENRLQTMWEENK